MPEAEENGRIPSGRYDREWWSGQKEDTNAGPHMESTVSTKIGIHAKAEGRREGKCDNKRERGANDTMKAQAGSKGNGRGEYPEGKTEPTGVGSIRGTEGAMEIEVFYPDGTVEEIVSECSVSGERD